jgi:ABC-type microcin C transport system permease subunit YejE
MMKNYYRFLHRCLYRFYIKLYKKNNKEYYSLRSTLEPYVISLCKKLLKKPNVTLLTSYELNKFYILMRKTSIPLG